jgi:multiple sugar transport system ATP-binding protein
MADRMAVMDGGVLQQYDRPERVFESPVNLFVAGFVGSPAMNFLKARVAGDATGAALEGADGWRVALSPRNAWRALAASSPEVVMGARHSTLRLSPEAAAGAVPGQVYTVEPTGDVTRARPARGGDRRRERSAARPARAEPADLARVRSGEDAPLRCRDR